MNVLDPNADRNAMIKPITYATLGIILFVGAAILISTLRHDAIAANAQNAPVNAQPGVTGRHLVAPGETLFSLARAYYGDAAKWPLIASANGITSPKSLAAGMFIVIPPANAPTRTPTISSEHVRQFVLRNPYDGQRIAAIIEDDGVTSVKLYVRSELGTTQSSSIEFPASTDTLAQAWVSDTDGDGSDELFTVWTRGKTEAITRLFRQSNNRLVIASESEHCPVAPPVELPAEALKN